MNNKQYINIGPETEIVEYKLTTAEKKEGTISIASILNKHREGDVYFGVKNNGDVIGQDITDKTLRDVSREIRDNIVPRIYPEITKEVFGDREVIRVHFKGDSRPYIAYNIARIRQVDEDILMDQQTYKELLLLQDDGKNGWERRISQYKVDDIDLDVFNKYLHKAKEVGRIEFVNNEPRTVLEKLELVDANGENLLNAGAALFCNLSSNDVQMAKFATDVRATFTDIRRYDKGTILGLADVCEQYIKDAIDWKADIVGLKRIETPEIPIEAVREAIINSFGHRLYGNDQCNEIAVFKNRIEVHTTGGFPVGHTPEEFLDGRKRAIRRNRLITQALYYSRDMETFATGLKRIKDSCDEAGCKVEFRAEKDNFVVIFYRNLRDKWNTQKVGVESQKVGVESQKVGVDKFISVLRESGIREKEAILEDFFTKYVSLEYFGRKDIVEELRCSTTTGDKIIRCLKESEMVEAVEGHGKGRYKLKKM